MSPSVLAALSGLGASARCDTGFNDCTRAHTSNETNVLKFPKSIETQQPNRTTFPLRMEAIVSSRALKVFHYYYYYNYVFAITRKFTNHKTQHTFFGKSAAAMDNADLALFNASAVDTVCFTTLAIKHHARQTSNNSNVPTQRYA